ncbi:MAG: lamin tail domain-containing protein [Pirellulales bacterium]|nr:lamin tail domain-containing protein [Pirellulales bacterium]
MKRRIGYYRTKSLASALYRRHPARGIEQLEPRELLAGDLFMFNDHVAGSGTHVNATTFASNGIASGLLKEIETGTDTAITLSVSGIGVSYENVAGAPAPGTDAAQIFDGYVDFRTGTGASLAISGTDTYTHVFSGLNSAATYDFAGTAVRGNTGYTDRWTLITLVGMDAFTPSHSEGAGVVTAGLGANQVAIWTGENHLANQGFVAQWLDIDPGADGQFQVISQQYRGPTPGVGSGNSSSGSKGYALHGIRLIENDTSMRVVASDPADGARLGMAPATATIHFNLPVNLASLEASDLTVSGTAAVGFTLVDSDTVQFQLPPDLAAGDQTLAMAAGSVVGGMEAQPLIEFSATFTIVAPATVDNVTAQGVEADSAILGAHLLDAGGDVTLVVIYWGDEDGDVDPSHWDHAIDVGSVGAGVYLHAINGLSEQTPYYFRAQATNVAGTSWAPATAMFTTPSITLPVVGNLPATHIGAVSARLGGEVTATGGATPIVTLYYGDEDAGTGTPLPWDHMEVVGPQAGSFSYLVTGLVPETTYFFRVRAENSAGAVWATPSLSFTTAAESNLSATINEVHYDPDIKTELVEFVELYNAADVSVDLSDWALTGAVSYTIPVGTMLAPGEYLVISQDPAAMQSKFGIATLGPFSGRLDNDGEDLELRDAAGVLRDLVDYRLGFPWPTVGDAPGHSIQLVHPDLDNELGGSWRSATPTPGAANSVLANHAAPQLRQVEHGPNLPGSGQEVTITVKATDPDGVALVMLAYQVVEPGDYIAIDDPRYEVEWTALVMNDDGTDGDRVAGDSIFTAVLPAAIQTHRRLVRYRITAEDTLGESITAPYADDPQPNFAYFVYDGVPAWTGATRPGITTEATYDHDLLESIPVYHLITTRTDHVDSQFLPDSASGSGYMGSDYLWNGTLVYDGHVYDHIRYRARGGTWRYAMGKNMWKFDFNRGHAFQARDNYGNEYQTKWDKLNFSAIIQQGDYLHRGEQGLFESVAFKLFNLAGSEAPNTQYVHFRIVENSDENGNDTAPETRQYGTDFQGLYLAIEQPDGRMLDEHGLPDGNFYKIENYNGELNNQGPTQPSDGSDLAAFKAGFNSSPTEQWWRENFDLDRYYSYRSIVEAVHHYDIAYGKNYFYYHNPETDLWSIHAWDIDLTWANNMFGSGNHAFKSLVADRAEFRVEYRNRMREIRDLLYNPNQTGMLIDEMASFIYMAGEPSLVDADRAMWDYNPIMISGYVNPSKAGHGRFYESSATDNFAGMIQLMKDYVVSRGAWIDSQILDDEALIPSQPTITYAGADGYPTNGLAFQTSDYHSSIASPFTAIEWRIGRVTDPAEPIFDPSKPRAYEINSIWESGELSTFDNMILVPGDDLIVGETYRVRARMKDTNGRWSHWSSPVQFVAAQPAGSVVEHLRITEINYNPYNALPQFGDLEVDNNLFEFVELMNMGDVPISLLNVQFTNGITFTFGDQTLESGARTLVVHDRAAFESRYGTDLDITGEFEAGSLSNSGERIRLQDANGGVILDFTYEDNGDWPGRPDGKGATLEVIDPASDYDSGSNWQSSHEFGGSPGTAGTGPHYDVIVNEILSHSDGASLDWIELYNTSADVIDVGRWYLSDTSDNLFQFQITAGTTIGAGHYLVLNETELGFGWDGQFGDDVWLVAADTTTGKPLRFADHHDFDATVSNVSLGHWSNGDPSGMLFPMTAQTLGSANSGPIFGNLLITEVHYNPAEVPPAEQDNIAQSELEFIELYNCMNNPLDISHWSLEGIGYTFPAGTTIAAGEAIVVITFDPVIEPAKADAFRNVFSVASSKRLFGMASGQLNNAGETVKLLRFEDPLTLLTGNLLVDAVRYDNLAPWPTSANGSGMALERVATNAFAPWVTSWTAATPSPGSVAFDLVTQGDFNTDGNVDSEDLDIWENGFGMTHGANLDHGDADGDGDVDGNDFLVWQLNFGSGTASGSAASSSIRPYQRDRAIDTVMSRLDEQATRTDLEYMHHRVRDITVTNLTLTTSRDEMGMTYRAGKTSFLEITSPSPKVEDRASLETALEEGTIEPVFLTRSLIRFCLK